MTKVLVLGTFDGVHDGHRAMLKQAKTLGSYLTAVVAADLVVATLKDQKPHHTSAQRITLVRQEKIADEVVLGDSEIGSWQIVKKYKPQIVALGYDQHDLRASLEEYLDRAYPEVETEKACPELAEVGWQTNPKRPKIVVLSAHEPDKYHNHIIHKKSN